MASSKAYAILEKLREAATFQHDILALARVLEFPVNQYS